MVVLNDLVMLGTTVPEPSSDNRVFVCSAGVSAELRQLVRVYPLARYSIPKRWEKFTVPLERNPLDSRNESWRVVGDRTRDRHSDINSRFERVDTLKKGSRAQLLKDYVVGSIEEANKRRLSLAIIQPSALGLTIEETRTADLAPPQGLFDLPSGEVVSPVARRFRFMPRISFTDECGEHNLMLRDWGSFELQRKNPEDYFLDNLESALNLGIDSSLLVGNLNNQRKAWIIISVLPDLRQPATLFDLSPEVDTYVTPKLRHDIFSRDEWRCVRCEQRAGLIVRSKNSTSLPAHADPKINELETLCKNCILDAS